MKRFLRALRNWRWIAWSKGWTRCPLCAPMCPAEWSAMCDCWLAPAEPPTNHPGGSCQRCEVPDLLDWPDFPDLDELTP